MKKNTLKRLRHHTALAVLVLVLGITNNAAAQDVTLNFRDAEIFGVLEFYSRLTGKVFVPSEQLNGRITVISPGPLSEEQAIKMLFSILDMRGFAAVEVDNYYKIVPKPTAITGNLTALKPEHAGDRLVTEIFTPRHIPVANLINSLSAIVSPEGKLVGDPQMNFIAVTDLARNIQGLKQLLKKIDRPSPINAQYSRSHRLQYVKAADIQPLVVALLQGESSLALSSSSTPTDAPQQQEQGLQPAPVNSGANTQNQDPAVLADERSNTLIVTGTQKQHDNVQVLIDELDTRSAQVMLEATIVEVILNDSNKLGTQWQQLLTNGDRQTSISLSSQGGGLLNEADLPIGSGLSFGLLSPGDYAALVSALATDTSATVLSAPHLMTSNNKEASLRVGDEIPFLKEFRLDADNNPIRTFERQKVGLDLNFTPNIAENRDVSLNLNIKISSVRPGGTTDNNEFTTSEREINTNVVVKDQQTLIISGLIRDNDTETSGGLPGLRKVPIAGKLFGNKEQNTEKGELLILIRPRVISSEDEARLASDLQLRKHPEAANAQAKPTEGLEFDL